MAESATEQGAGERGAAERPQELEIPPSTRKMSTDSHGTF